MFKKRDGFTLPEVLMTIGLMSFIALGVIPLLGKNLATLQRDDKLKDYHGIIECFYDETGTLRQFVWDYTNKEHNRRKGVLTYPTDGKCRISLPDVNFYKISLIGAGSRGYGQGTSASPTLATTQTANVLDKINYHGTTTGVGNDGDPVYYGKNIYNNNLIKKSTEDGTSRGTYNIIKLDDEFYSKFDLLPDPIRNIWKNVTTDTNTAIGPRVKYKVAPAAGKQHSVNLENKCVCDGLFECIGDLFSGDGLLESAERMRGNAYETRTYGFVVPPAGSGDKQLKFSYNTSSSNNKIIKIDNGVNSWTNGKSLHIAAAYFGNKACDGHYDGSFGDWVLACEAGNRSEHSIQGRLGIDIKFDCNNDDFWGWLQGNLSSTTSLLAPPTPRAAVCPTSDCVFHPEILSGGFVETNIMEKLFSNTLDLAGWDVSPVLKVDTQPEYNLKDEVYGTDYFNTKTQHALLFTGLEKITNSSGSLVCGNNYGDDNRPPCFTFDSQKVQINIPVGKRGSNGAVYEKIYEKVNAHELVLTPGKTDGAPSKVSMVKREGDPEETLITTLPNMDPFSGISATNSVAVSSKYMPNEDVATTSYNLFNRGDTSVHDILELMNDNIIDGSDADYTFARTFENAEKGSSKGMYSYFRSGTRAMNFGGPGRGGYGVQPYIGSTSSYNVNIPVEARIRDAIDRKKATGNEYIPAVVDGCLASHTGSGITQNTLTLADGTKQTYCTGNNGYGGAVIVTW